MKNSYEKNYFTDRDYAHAVHTNAYFTLLSNYIPEISNKKVLDIGCATGLFLDNFNSSACLGIDISGYAIKEAKKTYPDKTFKVIDINKKGLDSSIQFDMITAFDVLEHLYNYLHFKDILDKNLIKGGYFVLTTPNANGLLRILSKKNFTGEIDKTHTMLFTPYSMDFFLKRMGLRKIELFTPYSTFYYRNDMITRYIRFGGQIFGIYQK